MKRFLLFFLIPLTSFLIPISAPAQERVLLHISPNGDQEAVPLKKGVPVSEVLSRSTFQTSDLPQRTEGEAGGLIMAIKNFDPVADFAKFDHSLHQDVLFQWFVPTADCRVKELWWYNGPTHGLKNAVTIRAWYADPKLATRPSSVVTKFMGAYRDSGDGDGGVTPYRPAAGKNQWFYGNGAPDSATYRFDPLGYEVKSWHAGTGRTVTVDSAGWQHIVVQEAKDSVTVKLGELFGFTIANPALRSEIPVGQTEAPLDINGFPNTLYPRHSLKFYENGWTDTTKRGWYLRGDYEWGMYVVVEYTGDRAPTITTNSYGTTLKTTPRPITATVTDDNPSGGPVGVKSVRLFSKKGALTAYDSTLMTASDSVYSGFAPAGVNGDTIFWYILATDAMGNRMKTLNRSYNIFKRKAPALLVYNNAQYSLSVAHLVYTGSSRLFDRWSVLNDGTDELVNVCKWYYFLLVADGAFPAKNIMPQLKQWMDASIGISLKELFITSQDYGALIQPSGKDTVFPIGSFERDYLGIAALGPQDVGPSNRPYRVYPRSSSYSSNYFDGPFRASALYMADSAVSMWHYPTFELAFPGRPDGIIPTASAKKLLLGDDSMTVHAVMLDASNYRSMYMALDAGALQFRRDTSLHNEQYTTVTDPHYQWIADVGSIGNAFLFPGYPEEPWPMPEGIAEPATPYQYSLAQNYPNPFNPVATVEYEIAQRSHVQIELFNALGQVVRGMVNEEKMPGHYTVRIDASSLASGVYFYRMQAGSFTSVKKMVVMK